MRYDAAGARDGTSSYGEMYVGPQQPQTLSDMQRPTNQSRHQSDNNSTGVAFFGGASSSGGGGVQGIQHSAMGLSP